MIILERSSRYSCKLTQGVDYYSLSVYSQFDQLKMFKTEFDGNFRMVDFFYVVSIHNVKRSFYVYVKNRACPPDFFLWAFLDVSADVLKNGLK